MAHKLDFKVGSQKKRGLKPVPDKYKLSDGRPNISMSDGIAPAFPLIPHKYLPVSFQDINTQDWVVIPKGRLVSCLIPIDSDDLNTGVYEAQGGGGQTAMSVSSGESYYGVSKNIQGLIVPANGGADVQWEYGSDSVGVVPMDAGAGMVTSANDFLEIPANAPIGCMEHDVYQDLRGANLNYDMRNKNWGVLAAQLIRLPAVNVTAFATFSGIAEGFVAQKAGESTAYESVVTLVESLDDQSLTFPEPPNGGYGGEAILTDGPNFDQGGALMTAGCTEGDAGSGDFHWLGGFSPNGNNTLVIHGASGSPGNSCTNQFGSLTSGAQKISLTYADGDDGSGAPVGSDVSQGGAGMWQDIKWAGYIAAMKKYAFLTYNGENGDGFGGQLLQSDGVGNWMAQAGGVLSPKTAQTAGRLLGIDRRFSKDMLDVVQGPYDQKVAGTQTLGVPDFLYDFAKTCLVGSGYNLAAFGGGGKDEAYAIKAAIDIGVFGYAWIQLNIR